MSTRTIHVNDRSFRVRDDEHQRLWTKIENGTWEPDTFGVFDRFVTPETTLLDIGCWEGPTLLYAGQRARAAYGFEPDPVAFRGLERNLAANPEFSQIRILNQCVAAHSGEVEFGSRAGGGDTMSSLLFSEGQTRGRSPPLASMSLPRARTSNSPIFREDRHGRRRI